MTQRKETTFTLNEVLQILKSAGVDTECGGCMSQAFTDTGATHTCQDVPEVKIEIVTPLDPLEDPLMTGKEWNPAHKYTREMARAWKVWEWLDNHVKVNIHVNAALGCDVTCDGPYRPLRMDGMNRKGEIMSRDMTPAHFDRVPLDKWQWRLARWKTWRSCLPIGYAGENGMDHVRINHPDEIWRPVFFAQVIP